MRASGGPAKPGWARVTCPRFPAHDLVAAECAARVNEPPEVVIRRSPTSKGGIQTMKKQLVAVLALAMALVSMLPGLSAAGVNMQHNRTALRG